MICFVFFMGKIFVSKHTLNSFEKNVWYSNDFGGNFSWFGWFYATRTRLIEADPADQNETDPNESGSATLIAGIWIFIMDPDLHLWLIV